MRLVFLFASFSFCVSFVACTNAFDTDTLRTVREIFLKLNEISKTRAETPELDTAGYRAPDRICPAEISPTHCWSQNNESSLSLGLVIPEDSSGIDLAQFMIDNAQSKVTRHGFQEAGDLLQGTIRASVLAEADLYARVAALFVTKQDNILQVANSGQLWVGLFREGSFINSTKPVDSNKSTYLGQEGLLSYLLHVHALNIKQFVQEWRVEPGDVLIITWADLQEEFREIVHMAVETAFESMVPDSQIVELLKPYFNVNRRRQNVLAAVSLN